MEADFDGIATVMEPPIARVMEPFPDTWPVTEQDDRDVSYTTLRCWAQTELGFGGRSPTVRIDDPPAGEEAHLDFGLMGYVSGEGGKQRKLHVLIVTLPTSRYQFVWPTFLQTN